MFNTPDLVGKPFGKLTVESLHSVRDRHGNRQWLCRCSCGRPEPCIVTTNRLLKDITRSCGCLPHGTPRDLTGPRFGMGTVLRLSPERAPGGQPKWLLQCDCGNVYAATTNHLTQERTRSCGCLRDGPPYELAGQPFGKLVAVKLLAVKSKRGERLWHCRCDCGRSCRVAQSHLVSGHTKSCGCVGPLTSHRVRKEHRAKEQIVRNGVAWYSLRLTARLLGVDKSTLLGSKNRTGYKGSSPWLGGEGLPTLPLEGAFPREEHYFHGPSVDRAKAAQAATPLVPTAAGLIPIGAARRKLGISDRTLYRRLKVARVRIEKRRSRDRQGHPRWRAYVPQWFIDASEPRATRGQVAVERQAHPDGPGEEGVFYRGGDRFELGSAHQWRFLCCAWAHPEGVPVEEAIAAVYGENASVSPDAFDKLKDRLNRRLATVGPKDLEVRQRRGRLLLCVGDFNSD
jgi:hypothetical protein